MVMFWVYSEISQMACPLSKTVLTKVHFVTALLCLTRDGIGSKSLYHLSNCLGSSPAYIQITIAFEHSSSDSITYAPILWWQDDKASG